VNISKAKRALRGEMNAGTAALEALRRGRVALGRRSERAHLAKLTREPARLTREFANMPAADLLAHFRTRNSPQFFAGFTEIDHTIALQHQLFPNETTRLINDATAIVERHCWSLLGFGERCFGRTEIDWNRDPLSGFDWPRAYHAEIKLIRRDGSDVRVLWELNRLAHLITLGRAYVLTNEQKFSAEFFGQLAGWRTQNPVGSTVNWSCAMELALRTMNLLGAFLLFRQAPQMNGEKLKDLLRMFDQHGAHIKRNLEFSHIATSNHYLCDVTGLLWIGVMLPELQHAREWRDFGLREMLAEMDKQILADGADYEASTGYHRLKVELFLYSFILCHINGIDIEERYWDKLRSMLDYVRTCLRPDGRAPLIGDSDSGQAFPIVRRSGDDHAYVLALGAGIFQQSHFKIKGLRLPEEVLWILGAQGVREFESLPGDEIPDSKAFAEAGVYVLRNDDLYLLFNAGGVGVNGRGSHGHNDALSIEVSACGKAFIVDPGSYVYTADLHERHLFRSTAYHSTVEIDRIEQNSIDESTPFVIGDEASPRVLRCEFSRDVDIVAAEHNGYGRLPAPVAHRRVVQLDKRKRFWKVLDALQGEGEHNFRFLFVFAPDVEPVLRADGVVQVCDKMRGAKLFLALLNRDERLKLVSQWASSEYGARSTTMAAAWSVQAHAPLIVRWAIVPVCKNDDEALRLELIEQLRRETGEIRFGVFGASAMA